MPQMFGDEMIPAPGEKGVHYSPPPGELIPEITGSIKKALEGLDADMAIMAVADRKGGWNAAVVVKTPDSSGPILKDIYVKAWIGKDWGSNSDLDWGVQVVKTIKFGRP